MVYGERCGDCRNIDGGGSVAWFVFCRLRRRRMKRDSKTRAVARQTGLCVSESGSGTVRSCWSFVGWGRAPAGRRLTHPIT